MASRSRLARISLHVLAERASALPQRPPPSAVGGATWESLLALARDMQFRGKDGITESPEGMTSPETAPPPREGRTAPAVTECVDVAIVGAGFSGLGVAKRLLDAGVETVRLFERGNDVGGTWFWNRYPDAACDSMTHSYSYSFERDWM